MKLPAMPPPFDLAAFGDSPQSLVKAMAQAPAASDDYQPWERFRFSQPPAGLTVEQWWMATWLHRRAQQHELPFRDVGGKPFTFALPDVVLRLTDRVASRAGGSIGMSKPVTSPATRDTYLVRSLMEESITSSQLEGAATTRRVAKDMLLTGRDPLTSGERMIWNNYRAMQFIREQQGSPLTPALVRELHQVVTQGTLADERDGGRLQLPGEERVRVETYDGDVVHEPPPAEQLPDRLRVLCDFANDSGSRGPWLHPVLRAIAVHFMVGYDHYFVDGNGRLARALFYWAMLRHGLWLAEFVTISSILRRAPAKYARSYLNTEYESDLTYFFVYHLGVLDRAFDDLESYLEAKIRERRDLRSLMSDRQRDFNHRQLNLIESAVAEPGVEYTVTSHSRAHRVTPETARHDLLELEEHGILVRGKRGRAHVWRAAPRILDVLRG